MSVSSNPTVRRRRLGMELRRLREALGMKGEEAARRLGWSPSKISKIETGRMSVHHGDVRDMLDLYEVADQRVRAALIQLARDARQQGWWQPYSDLLSRNSATYIGLESAAESLREYRPLNVPGMFQTEDYARAVILGGGPLELREAETERRVALRLERQAFLRENAKLDVWLILHEAALRCEIGDALVMRDQLRRLIQEAHSPWVTLQVIPFSAGAHPSMAGSFGVFTFPEENDRGIAYIDSATGILYLERQEEVKAANLTFDHLIAAALNKDDSRALLEAVADEYDRK
ncbi:transcriptional regulator [Actinomadura craniellae]|uniref:Transcriptional regulator n=1 Tax=Actinomadura craniellae TaxID=2231787 RepID=A0A365H1X9_9ACTN|nr:helix-turn-helix transcriptional regulator [Actinomadura craniellae]RAY13048.1 transcriptional regulator [Actinomadura craniellae]